MTGRLIGFLLLVSSSPAAASSAGCGPLFVVERSLNKNVVVYEASRDTTGRLDPKKPVHVFWLMKAEDGRATALSFFERIRAYGIESAAGPEPGAFSLKTRAMPGRTLVLRDGQPCAHVTTEIAGRGALLARVFVTAAKGLFPSVSSVDVFGSDAETGAALSEHIDTSGKSR